MLARGDDGLAKDDGVHSVNSLNPPPSKSSLRAEFRQRWEREGKEWNTEGMSAFSEWWDREGSTLV
jgi:hypothetical protein